MASTAKGFILSDFDLDHRLDCRISYIGLFTRPDFVFILLSLHRGLFAEGHAGLWFWGREGGTLRDRK